MAAASSTADVPAARPATAVAAPLQGGALVLGSLALALATFMNVLDTSIANVSLPTIAGDLGVSAEQGTWIITSFAVANAISLPLTGWLSQRYGQVRLFTASVVLFVIASFLCGFAPSMGLLIFFRVIQGAVAGPMIPLSQSLLLSSYPKQKAGTALAMWSITTLVAPGVGPLLGGWITDDYSWPWIFYINVPIGIAAAAVTWVIYSKRETATRKLPIDTVGLGLLIIWVGALQVMLDKGKDLDWFNSTFITALAITTIVGFALFLVWELTEQHPIVHLRLFKVRNFWTGTLAVSLGYGTFFGNIVLLPLWLQKYMGYTATLAGVTLAPVALFAVVLSPVVGKTIDRVDARIFATASFVVFAVMMFMRSHFNTQADLYTILMPTIVQGVAVAIFFIPLITISLAGVPPDQIAAATGLSNFARVLAGSFGTSIVTTLWDDRAKLHHSHLVEYITTYSPVSTQSFANLQALGLNTGQSHAMVNRVIDQQAFLLSAIDIFYASAILFLLLIPVIWLAKPCKGTLDSAGGGGSSFRC